MIQDSVKAWVKGYIKRALKGLEFKHFRYFLILVTPLHGFACREGQFDVVKLMVSTIQFKDFSINLNAQDVNGMTHFDLMYGY